MLDFFPYLIDVYGRVWARLDHFQVLVFHKCAAKTTNSQYIAIISDCYNYLSFFSSIHPPPGTIFHEHSPTRGESWHGADDKLYHASFLNLNGGPMAHKEYGVTTVTSRDKSG
jgi:hypothetical protein